MIGRFHDFVWSDLCSLHGVTYQQGKRSFHVIFSVTYSTPCTPRPHIIDFMATESTPRPTDIWDENRLYLACISDLTDYVTSVMLVQMLFLKRSALLGDAHKMSFKKMHSLAVDPHSPPNIRMAFRVHCMERLDRLIEYATRPDSEWTQKLISRQINKCQQ